MNKTEPWFVMERTKAFASLLLTTRKDLVIQPHQDDSDDGVDLLVEVIKDGKPTLRFFGVQLIGCTALPNIVEAAKDFCAGAAEAQA